MTQDEIRKKFAYIAFLDDDDAVKVLKQQPSAIAILDNPSYKLQKIALEHGGPSVFPYIKNTHINTCKRAIMLDYTNITYVKNPSVALQIYAVKRNYRAYYWIQGARDEVTKVYESIKDAHAYFKI